MVGWLKEIHEQTEFVSNERRLSFCFYSIKEHFFGTEVIVWFPVGAGCQILAPIITIIAIWALLRIPALS